MSLYKKYILPKYLNRVMQAKDLEEYRMDVVSGLSGTGLEIGFGSGLNLPYYKNISKLYALEPSEELFQIAQKNIVSASFPIEYLRASAESIPLPDSSLDFVVSTWTLCSIPHPEMALKEVFRVLKSGGVFSFVEHGTSPRPLVSMLQNVLTPVSKCVGGGCHMNRDIEKYILNAGFAIQKIKKFSRSSKPLGYIYEGIALAKK